MLSEEQVKNEFREVLQLFTLKSPTAQIFERAFVLRERYSLSHWDVEFPSVMGYSLSRITESRIRNVTGERRALCPPG